MYMPYFESSKFAGLKLMDFIIIIFKKKKRFENEFQHFRLVSRKLKIF